MPTARTDAGASGLASLNWREIDLVLSEMELPGLSLREIHQPDAHTLLLEVAAPGRAGRLLVRLAPPGVRLHLTRRRLAAAAAGATAAAPHPAPKRGAPPRFAAFLRAHVRGGRIIEAAQVGQERMVRIHIRRAETDVILWLRLWSNAANAVLTDPDGRILDSFYRRPGRGELTGQILALPQPAASGRVFEIRALPGEGTFNERLDLACGALERSEAVRISLQGSVRLLQQHEARTAARLETLERQVREHAEYDRYRSTGDAILANLGQLRKGARWLELQDRRVELDPTLTPTENAQAYFARYKRSRATLARLEQEVVQASQGLARVRSLLALAAPEEGAEALAHAVEDLGLRRAHPGRAVHPKTQTPGLQFQSGPFTILVGRTATENDVLLRRHVRGNDLWFHCRDFPGAHVFVRSLAGKSVPLEVMLDAANLAVHYSKAKASGAADVYYTAVKYLRRPRDGTPGLVLPTQEKNLHVRLERARVERLERAD
jgi:predicted ribosome quality control (RQC) complex YloA/Tae2 family protein